MKKQSGDNVTALASLKQEIIKEQKTVYEQFFRFQDIFNDFFNQRIQMVFITDDKKLVLMDNDLSHVVTNQYGSLEYALTDTKQQILKNFEYDSSTLDKTASSVYERWDKAKKDAINRGVKKQAGLPILWKIAGNIDGRIVNNKGTIAEAYANFYLNSIEFAGKNLEYNVGTYVTDPQYGMASVDNKMGFAAGDISRGGIQYAIKSARAGLAGMHRVYQYIKKIKKELLALGAGTEGDQMLIDELFKKVNSGGNVKQVRQIVADKIETNYESLIQLLGLSE